MALGGICGNQPSRKIKHGALQGGPGGPWSAQNFGWVGHSAFGPTNNWAAINSQEN